jgi:phenylalanyl-tRNA synthetase alpha chain
MSTPDIKALVAAFEAALHTATTLSELDEVRRIHTGKKSGMKAALKSLRDLSAEERPKVAAAINETMQKMVATVEAAKVKAETAAIDAKIAAEWLDLSMPGTTPKRGALHPVTVVERRCMALLRRLGFSLVDGPEVDGAYYNFDALNIPEHHPARDAQDTFWVDDGLLLRSHTTTVQIRVLEQRPSLPIKVASSGRVYRNEAVDATHLAMFHQMEGLWVDKGLTFAHLKGVLTFIAKELYGDHKIRFKPKFYPYTEPSVGVDLACTACNSEGCESCHGAGWVTILGAGMMHPKVLMEFGYDPDIVSGIAFGLGTSRMASQWSGISKVRSLYEMDTRVHKALHRRADK